MAFFARVEIQMTADDLNKFASGQTGSHVVCLLLSASCRQQEASLEPVFRTGF